MNQVSSADRSGHDVIVVGLGAVGSAVAYQAGRLGLRVLGIDRYQPPHRFGSSHGETRFSRLAVGEGSHYLPLAKRSHEIWRELEEVSGRPLFHQCGGMIVTEPSPDAAKRWGDFVTRSAAVADEAGIEFHLLDASAATDRHPALRGLEGKRIGLEPTAGLVACEAAVTVQLDLAKNLGAELRLGETVQSIEPDRDGVVVVTEGGRYRGDHVLVAAGPWLPQLLTGRDQPDLTVTRQVVFWFEADDLAVFSTDQVPLVMWIGETIDDFLAVFPRPSGMTRAVKVLGEQFADTTDPERVDRAVSPAEAAAFHARNVAPRVAGITDRLVKAEVCLYTNTADDHFLIDTAFGSDRVTVVSACSGHGFKHSAALGEAMVERLATGRSTIDLSRFDADRLSR